jgi:hypothetical protein
LDERLAIAAKYKHRPVGSRQAFVHVEGQSVPATDAEVEGLEVLATWFSNHIEQRLEDFFAGRPNKFAQSLQLD